MKKKHTNISNTINGMLDQKLTTYRAKGKDLGLEFLFKYDLKGNLRAFQVADGELNGNQMKWLFSMGNFPASESIIKSVWMREKGYKDKFDITVAPADWSKVL